jgi:sulfur transfer complex TusBCD TusB component (DsrH family)
MLDTLEINVNLLNVMESIPQIQMYVREEDLVSRWTAVLATPDILEINVNLHNVLELIQQTHWCVHQKDLVFF